MFDIYPGKIQRGYNINLPDFKSVSTGSDFPSPVNGVITLADNTAYLIAGTVDINGARIVSGQNSTLFGVSPELSILKSTGFDDSNGAFLTSEYTTPVNFIGFHDFDDQQVLAIDGDGNNAAYDWSYVNFLNCSNVGTIENISNFIGNTFGFLNSGGLTFDGSVGTVSFADSLFEAPSGTTVITLPSTLTITRRFRIIYSSFVILSGETGINASASATIPNEGYILHDVNFGGGGTYLVGLDNTSEKSRFAGCRGISNTASIGAYIMTNNATTTTATTAGTFYKIAGTTVAGTNVEKFTITDNRATYTGSLTSTFSVKASCSIDMQVGRNFTFKIAVNGQVQSSQSIVRGLNTINLECSVFDTVELSTGDYVEVFVSSSQNSTNVAVTDMNVLINKIGD